MASVQIAGLDQINFELYTEKNIITYWYSISNNSSENWKQLYWPNKFKVEHVKVWIM